MSLDAACFGEKPLTPAEELRQRCFVAYWGRYGVPDGDLLWVPPDCAFKPGERLFVGRGGERRKAVVRRHDQELGIIEVVYGDSSR